MAEELQERIEAFLDECAGEREQVERQLDEIEMLISQSSSEVERLERRHADATNRLRQLESNFDTVPREDIQTTYAALQREQGRLFTMRGQLEKLQENQTSLQRRAELLDRTMEILGPMVGGLEMPSAAEAVSPEQAMVVRVIEAQESERKRLSRKMHDGPAQLLTNVVLQAEICQRLLDTDPVRAREELDLLKGEVLKTFQRTRAFIADLRPMMLDDLGLVPTLRRYVSSWSEETGIQAELTIMGKARRLAPYSEVTIFRAVQQLMENAAQHAKPSIVRVTLDLDGDRARVVVDDDGVGFDIDQVMEAAGARKTIGIASIMDRVQMLGGSLTFDSGQGTGTRATVEVPGGQPQA